MLVNFLYSTDIVAYICIKYLFWQYRTLVSNPDIQLCSGTKKKLTKDFVTIEKVFLHLVTKMRKREGLDWIFYGPSCLGSAPGHHVSHGAMVDGRRAAGRGASVTPLCSSAFWTAVIIIRCSWTKTLPISRHRWACRFRGCQSQGLANRYLKTLRCGYGI